MIVRASCDRGFNRPFSRRPFDLRRQQRATGGGSSGWRLYYANGTFSRTAQATYQTGAPTDGSTAFLATAAANTPVYEDLGDGAGALLRVEGARTNKSWESRDMSGTSWTAGTATMTYNDVASPDGSTHGARIAGTSAQYGNYRVPATVTGLVTGQPAVASAWCRAHSGTGTARFETVNLAATQGFATVFTPGTTYQRLVLVWTPDATSAYYIPADGRAAYGGGSPTAIDACFDYHQVEVGAFPSSCIVTPGSADVTRDADVLTFTSGQLPASFFTRAGRFTQLSAIFGSADLVAGDTFVLWGIDGANFVALNHDGTGVSVHAVQGGALKAASGYLTFARNALLGVVQWDPVNAIVSVNGVAGAAGTPWSWTPGTVRIGGLPAGGSDAFCRFGVLTSA